MNNDTPKDKAERAGRQPKPPQPHAGLIISCLVTYRLPENPEKELRERQLIYCYDPLTHEDVVQMMQDRYGDLVAVSHVSVFQLCEWD